MYKIDIGAKIFASNAYAKYYWTTHRNTYDTKQVFEIPVYCKHLHIARTSAEL